MQYYLQVTFRSRKTNSIFIFHHVINANDDTHAFRQKENIIFYLSELFDAINDKPLVDLSSNPITDNYYKTELEKVAQKSIKIKVDEFTVSDFRIYYGIIVPNCARLLITTTRVNSRTSLLEHNGNHDSLLDDFTKKPFEFLIGN
jgi:uncharacterized protein YtpQ (UPF0354 family)